MVARATILGAAALGSGPRDILIAVSRAVICEKVDSVLQGIRPACVQALGEQPVHARLFLDLDDLVRQTAEERKRIGIANTYLHISWRR